MTCGNHGGLFAGHTRDRDAASRSWYKINDECEVLSDSAGSHRLKRNNAIPKSSLAGLNGLSSLKFGYLLVESVELLWGWFGFSIVFVAQGIVDSTHTA